jgi:hypothetical protein
MGIKIAYPIKKAYSVVFRIIEITTENGIIPKNPAKGR